MKSFMATVVEVLRERGPLEIFSLAAASVREPKPTKKEDLWVFVAKILEAAKGAEYGTHVVEYPTYRLRVSVPKCLPPRRYVRAAVEALAASARPLSLEQLTAHYLQRYGRTARVPEYQMLLALHTEGRKLIAEAGELRVGLKPDAKPVDVVRGSRAASARTSDGMEPIHAKMYEENLESLIVERLEEVEPGLSLVQRQYATPVGRIDLLCRDRKGNLVVIELKRFRASTESIIDQVTRYMGWVQQHLAKPSQTVRACIVVGKVDNKLEYSVRAIPNLRVKCLRVSLSDPD